MRALDTVRNRFRHFPEALCAVDVTLQQSFCPSCSITEGKLYFSGKHKLYGVKVKVVLPNGLAVACSNHYPGSVSDFEIDQRQRENHEKLLKKESERSIMDVGMYCDRYPTDWAVCCDKGYQGLLELMRAIHPIKNPPHGNFSVSDEVLNQKLSRVTESKLRIVLEEWAVCGLFLYPNGGGVGASTTTSFALLLQ